MVKAWFILHHPLAESRDLLKFRIKQFNLLMSEHGICSRLPKERKLCSSLLAVSDAVAHLTPFNGMLRVDVALTNVARYRHVGKSKPAHATEYNPKTFVRP